MAVLQIGRVGLDVDLSRPDSWEWSAANRGRTEQIHFQLFSTSLANTQALKLELLNHVDQAIPVTFSDDLTVAGFYILRSVDIDADDYSLNDFGLFSGTVTVERVGTVAQTQMQSLLTAVLATNDMGLIDAEVQYWHALPVGALAANYDPGTPTEHSRTADAGVVPTFLGISKTVDPTWTVEPADWHKAACYVKVDGYTRTGLDAVNDPPDWELGNGILKITPGTSTGVSDGRLQLQTFSGGGFGAAKKFKLDWNAATTIPKWHMVTIIKNTPEVVVVKLVRDAETSPPSAFRHELDITLRRGAIYASCYYYYTGAAVTLRVGRDSAEAATAITPTGATAVMAIRATANDGDGDRYVVGAARTHTQDTTNGTITITTARQTHDFFIGAEPGGSGAGANDQADAMCRQYLAWISEHVRTVRR